jgi:RNA polymerase sigma-70 factor (ECF subfamily)
MHQTRVSFAAIYNDYFEFVWRNLRLLGISEGALRDAAQDVFVVVHRRLSEFDGSDRLRPWLYSIVRRVAADHRRRSRRKERPDSEQPDSIIDPHEPGPENRAARGESLRLLVTLLGELDESWRDLIVLVDLEGFSVPEAAQIIGCNTNTAYSRMRSARQMMQVGFEQHLAEERRSR